MKNYLNLISISAKIHRRQTRMTRWCIIISVFLISAIFGMADMFLQSQKNLAVMTDGAWHVMFRELDEEQMTLLAARPEVKTAVRYAAANYKLDMGYSVAGVQTVLCGFDESFFEIYPGARLLDGGFPREEGEALVTESMRDREGLCVGDIVEVTAPDGSLSFRISGFVEDTSMLLQTDAFGVFMNIDTYMSCFRDVTRKEDIAYYVEFVPHCRIQKAIRDICSQLCISEDMVSENAKLMGSMMQSSDNYIMMLYLAAFILAVLVSISGMMMILGSMNSNVAQRTEFFGMMRCLGATGKQVRRYVRMEALSWCLKSIPQGLLGSVVMVWALCRMLQLITPTWFREMPAWGISWPGMGAGLAISLLTVLLASRTPARKASAVSPLTAVSGNADTVFAAKRAAHTRWMHVETALGLHHAAGSRKNLILLTSSFAFSIVLFLGFGIGVDFMKHAIVSLRPDTPDVSIVSSENTGAIPDSLIARLKENPEIERVFIRAASEGMPDEKGKMILDIQLRDLSDDVVEEIRSMAGEGYRFSDSRAKNRETRAVYFSFALFVYGFLAVVALIASFHIINSIAMGAAARMRQYGAMRAIGISVRQLQKMIAAETFAYLFGGLAEGLILGLPIHYYLYRWAITGRWGDVWRFPLPECLVIAAVMTVSALAAMTGPVRKIRGMSVVETINKR